MSLADTGFVILQNDRSIVKAISIKTKPKMLDLSRQAYIAETIFNTLEEYAGDRKIHVIIEAIPFSRRPTGKHFTRTGAVDILKYVLVKAGYPVYMIGATTIKNRFAGKGNSDKDAIIAAIKKKYTYNIRNNNVADAFAAADLLIAYLGKKVKLTLELMPSF